jgi:hypothetical protein
VHRVEWQLWAGLLLVVGGILLVLLVWPGADLALMYGQPPAVSSTQAPEHLIPTRTPTGQALIDLPPAEETRAQYTQELPVTPELVLPATPATRPLTGDRVLWWGRPRWGIGVASGPISRYDTGPLRLGWYLDWRTQANPPRPLGVAYVQMIRLEGGTLNPGAREISAIARANPGALWLVGNEPDVEWQDNLAPETYAELYHQAYAVLKSADPTAQVAIAGVSQPTPLRLRYLDAVLEAYRERFGTEIPVDVWNVHNFILQELRGGWGVGIPPELSADQGMLYEVDDSDNLDVFRQQIMAFRQWMAERGYRDYPLIVSEYGILMPEDFGFPPERVAGFLAGTFDFFLTASDPALGHPADSNRLVQMWCWYSLDAPADYYPTSNLFDPETGALTAVGEAWTRTVE